MKPFQLICAATCTICAVLSSFAGQSISVPSKEARTIPLAMIAAKPGDTVIVANGVYGGEILVKPDVILKSASLLGAILDGGNRGTVVTLGANSEIMGFEVRCGAIGIESKSGGGAIRLCRVTGNVECGILCVGNIPRIEDNAIVYNAGSGIQGWNLVSTSASVNHNTIAYNLNNGIAIGGNSNVVLEFNIIVFNGNLAVKTTDRVRTSLANNDFYGNGRNPSIDGADNLSVDPKFSAPRNKLDFSLMPDSPLQKSFSGATISIGARFSYSPSETEH
jgi:hypothetical protein